MDAPRAVVLVEGDSDRRALHTLAGRLGRDLAADGVEVVVLGGITNIRSFALRYGPGGLGVPLAGLYDAPAERIVRRGLAAAGVPVDGFFRCTEDLEDELIRALGVAAVEDVIAAAGEARSLELLAGMPAQRSWTRDAVLRRFMGSKSGRKDRYAELLVAALPLDRVPAPLTGVLRCALDLSVNGSTDRASWWTP
ncbi:MULTISPECIES: TOPRIM nucleotidyl transferase/hydrolase domain-containing protein [unclassified Nocardioides]|uniref:TOPRIM nucleotidyl transferase/hydrolase domain-containing protein n=1 Tax=unclassified Nocardioides TaxID=2615069 RepID=UPI00361ED7A7